MQASETRSPRRTLSWLFGCSCTNTKWRFSSEGKASTFNVQVHYFHNVQKKCFEVTVLMSENLKLFWDVFYITGGETESYRPQLGWVLDRRQPVARCWVVCSMPAVGALLVGSRRCAVLCAPLRCTRCCSLPHRRMLLLVNHMRISPPQGHSQLKRVSHNIAV